MSKLKILFICSVVVSIVSSFANADTLPVNKYLSHHVSKGETLKKIAQYYYDNELYFWPIVDLNNIPDPDLIFAGATLKIEKDPAKDKLLQRPVGWHKKPADNIVLQPRSVEKPKGAELVKSEILEVKVVSIEADRGRGLRVGLAYGAGCGLVQAGTDFKVGSILLNAVAGVGLGKNYSMADLQISKEIGMPGDYRLGISGIYAYCSRYILNIPWTYQVLDKGSNFGLGIYVGKDINGWEGKVGYSPIFGPNFSLSKYL